MFDKEYFWITQVAFILLLIQFILVISFLLQVIDSLNFWKTRKFYGGTSLKILILWNKKLGLQRFYNVMEVFLRLLVSILNVGTLVMVLKSERLSLKEEFHFVLDVMQFPTKKNQRQLNRRRKKEQEEFRVGTWRWKWFRWRSSFRFTSSSKGSLSQT